MADIQGFDPGNGTPVTVPQEAAATWYKQGKIKFKPDALIPITLNGTPGTLPAEHLDAALGSGEAELNFDPNGTAKAAAAGGLRGLSMGASDWLAVEGSKLVDPDAAEKHRLALDALREEHPVVSTAAELGGAILPSLIPGGAELEAGRLGATGAREAAAASRLAGSVSEATTAVEGIKSAGQVAQSVADAQAASGVTKGSMLARTLRAVNPYEYVGKAGSVAEDAAGRLLGGGRVAGMAKPLVKFAAEGALIGLAGAADEAELGDTNLTGEAALANIEHGALWGVGFGLVGTGASKIMTSASRMARRLAEAQMGGSPTEMKAMLGRFGAGNTGARMLEEGYSPFMSAEQKYEWASNIHERDGSTLGQVVKDADTHFEGVSADEVRSETLNAIEEAKKQYAMAGGNPDVIGKTIQKELERGLGWREEPELIALVDNSKEVYEKAVKEEGLIPLENLKRPRPPNQRSIQQYLQEISSNGDIGGEPTFYRVQPKGNSLHGHTSSIGDLPVEAGHVMAFKDPNQMFDTYTWNHVRRNIDDYEMVAFHGSNVHQPPDTEGLSVKPGQEVRRVPLSSWLDAQKVRTPITSEEIGQKIQEVIGLARKNRTPLSSDAINPANVKRALQVEREATAIDLQKRAKAELMAKYDNQRRLFESDNEAHNQLRNQAVAQVHDAAAGAQRQYQRLLAATKEYNKNLRVSFEQVRDVRKRLDRVVPWNYVHTANAVDNAAVEVKLAARGALEGKVEKALDEQAAKIGDDEIKGRYLHAKQRYAQSAEMVKQTERGRARHAGTFGRPSRVGGIGSHLAFAAAGLAVGHPLGGLAAGVVSQAAKHYGPGVAAVAMHKATRLAELKALRQEVQIATRRGVRAAVGHAEPKMSSPVNAANMSPHETRMTAAKAMAQVLELAKNPASLRGRLIALDPSFPIVAPKSFAAAEGAFRRQVLWMVQQVPPAQAQKYASGDPVNPRDLSDSQARDFMEHYAVMAHPTIATDALATGSLTTNQSRAYKAAWPALQKEAVLQYKRMQAMDRESFDFLSHTKKSQLSSLVGDDDPSFTLHLQALAQASLASQAPQGRGASPASSGLSHAAATSKGMAGMVGLMGSQAQIGESGPPGRRGRSGRSTSGGF